jgi:uncharacterized protein (DUF697 family)
MPRLATTVLRGANRLRPLLKEATQVARATAAGGALAVLPGERLSTERLQTLLSVGARDLPPHLGLVVHAAVPDAIHEGAAKALAARKAGGGKVLVVFVGRPGARRRMEAEFLAHEPLELGDTVHVASLEGPGARRVLRTAVITLGSEAIAASRLAPALRPVVAEHVIARSCRQAGFVGAAVFLPGADMPVLTALQVRMVVELAALYGRPVGQGERSSEIAAVFAAGFGWRAVVREALCHVPGPGWAIKGGMAFVSTRALGEAARRWFEEGGDLVDKEESLVSAVAQRLPRRGGK